MVLLFESHFFAGLARNKEKNLHNSLKFSCMALHFQSQTAQSLQHLCLMFVWFPSVNRVKPVSIVYFPSIEAVEEKKPDEKLSASFSHWVARMPTTAKVQQCLY